MTRTLADIKLPNDFRDTHREYRHLRDGGVTQRSALNRVGWTFHGYEQACRRHGITAEETQ